MPARVQACGIGDITMKIVAVYNMKGGVGKTTTAVNLSYLAAASGRRTLLWDLDPQGAASFAFRIRPHVAGFKKGLAHAHVLAAAIKQTDYPQLDLLPADFAYRKLERMLDRASKPERAVQNMLATVAEGYDVVFLDCPAGFSLLTEGIFVAADTVLVPTIPTVLSLRMVARLIKWTMRTKSQVDLAAFFNMVDRRKALHRRATAWSLAHPDLFLTRHVPYVSVVEQMTVRRAPLPVFAPRDPATAAFTDVWTALQTRMLAPARQARESGRPATLDAIETLVAQLESGDTPIVARGSSEARDDARGLAIVHQFDTSVRDLERIGHVLELREQAPTFVVTARDSSRGNAARAAHAEIDRTWALEILTGVMSPLEALERRLGHPGPALVGRMRATVDGRPLLRTDSRHEGAAQTDDERRAHAEAPIPTARVDRIIPFEPLARRQSVRA
jgi:chromosome partitioning protein